MTEGIDRNIDVINEFCDLLIDDGNMAVLDSICRAWPVGHTKSEAGLNDLLSVLTATLPVRSRLPSRNVMLKRAEFVYGNENGLFDGL